MPVPHLYIFPISHYCEKARWALDYLGIDYELHCVAPGVHGDLAKKLGANGTSLPILVSGDQVIQGSGQIIEWAESLSDNGRSLIPISSPSISDIEHRLNEVLGVHVRRMYYSEALIECPETVLPIFMEYLPAEEAQFVSEAWEVITAAMVERMDLGMDQRQESRQIVMEHLDWLDALLADGDGYIAGDAFSSIDISASALLAPLAMPQEHPTYGGLQVPPRMTEDIANWKHRPVTNYVAEMYRLHRKG
ncbi:MAG: glutathione S-transferase family protein [Halieaceae bacterium]